MPGDLKIILVAQFMNAEDIAVLKSKIEQLVSSYAREFKIERIEYAEFAKRPAEEMMITALLDIGKKLDELRTSQSD